MNFTYTLGRLHEYPMCNCFPDLDTDLCVLRAVVHSGGIRFCHIMLTSSRGTNEFYTVND